MDWIERSRLGSRLGRVDRISALPDDLLLLLLSRLGCAAASARTSVLSRRWRGLWTHLRQIVFRDVAFPFLEAALGSVSPAVSLLEIRVPVPADPFPRRRVPEEHWPLLESSGIDSLLRAAARTVPEEFVIALPPGSISSVIGIDLPCFHRATSIVLDSAFFLNVPAGVMFPVLEKLSLLGCVVDLDALLSRCPHLRVLCLRLSGFRSQGEHLKVHSASLQQLVVNTGGSWVERFDIVAPSLKQLTMYLISSEMVGISILAPMVAKVLWWYVEGGIGFGVWRLKQMRLQAAERQGELSLLHIHVSKSSAKFYGEEDGFTREIEKYMITDFSSLELHLITKGHIFGALVVHLLGTNRICSAMQRLKIVLQKSMRKERCPTDCRCKPTTCRSQTISLTALEEVQINGFEGGEPEIDFLKMIFKCAPLLKRMTVKLSHEASASNAGCTQIYNISKAYTSVEFCVLP